MTAGESSGSLVLLPSAVIEKSLGAFGPPPPALNGNFPGGTTVELPLRSSSVKFPSGPRLIEQDAVNICAASLYRAR
ncbi:hypothetical protein Poly59_36120 [Rubripirellula reticaptiva]|uniref:Uncharacterized protein n=1 Tax=Rubripirellula reticaptiva TaxID=2528013 RepID=A0A5C6ETH9_9BACT|nr:hypothetical protein Poly59_36120 [Rubripirellula reticaptiva]